MKKHLKLMLIYIVIIIPMGLLFGVLFGFSLNILYENTREAFIHGFILGMLSAFGLGIYEFISGIFRRTFLDPLLSDQIDEK